MIEKYASLIFMNREEGRALLGGRFDDQLDGLAKRVDTVVLKLGAEEASFVGVTNGRIDAPRVEAVDTTGAGDPCRGLPLRDLRGWDLERCGKLAEVAALTVSQVGGVVRDASVLAEALKRVQ